MILSPCYYKSSFIINTFQAGKMFRVFIAASIREKGKGKVCLEFQIKNQFFCIRFLMSKITKNQKCVYINGFAFVNTCTELYIEVW